MPRGVVKTTFVSTAKVRTLFCLAKGLCVFLGFGGRFDGGCQNGCGSGWVGSWGRSTKSPRFRWKTGGGGLFLFLNESRNGGNECDKETDAGKPRAVEPKGYAGQDEHGQDEQKSKKHSESLRGGCASAVVDHGLQLSTFALVSGVLLFDCYVDEMFYQPGCDGLVGFELFGGGQTVVVLRNQRMRLHCGAVDDVDLCARVLEFLLSHKSVLS